VAEAAPVLAIRSVDASWWLVRHRKGAPIADRHGVVVIFHGPIVAPKK